MRFTTRPMTLRTALAASFIACAGPAFAADEPTAAPAAPAFSVKNTFQNICGFCHQDYGRHAGKGPQLMNSERSDEYLFNRIKNGKPGRMAAFGGAFTDDQIHDIVKFIRALRPDQEL